VISPASIGNFTISVQFGWIIMKNSQLLFFIPLAILLGCISSVIFAEGTETTRLNNTTMISTNAPPDIADTRPAVDKAALAKEISMQTLWFGLDEVVSIATRHNIPIGKSPGIVTVITDEEIKNLGFRTFVEVLRTVPGFEILKLGDYGTTAPSVRGLSGSDKIRLMIDGHLVNSPLSGGAFVYFDDFPVENIKRIEIIRGPGSALYGENAFSAVINIITKGAKDINGVRVSSGYGSFDTYDENVVFGDAHGPVEVSGMAHYRQTTGYDGTVKSDSQSIIDRQLAPFRIPAASVAPGSVEDWRQEYDLDLKMVYKDFYVHGFYLNKDRGPFIGAQYALNDETRLEDNYVFGEVGYKKTFDEKLTIKPRAYYDQFDSNNYVEALPEGSTILVNSTLQRYPDGFIGQGRVAEKIAGAEIPFDYKLFDENLVTLGFEYRLINQTNVGFLSNFNPATLAPLNGLQDFSDTYPFLEEATRRIGAVYLQDTWDLTDTVNLTLGVRHDQYSDFGGTTNPRAGITWAFIQNASLKILYGEAFRPPSFLEMFSTNQPAIQGNEDLHPETIRSYETGLSYKFNKYVASSVNYFNNTIEDLIALQTTQNTSRFENFGNAHVQGFEMETKVDITEGNYVFMNYTFQHSADDNGDDLPFVAQHTGNFGVNVHYWKYINTNLNTFISGSRSREADDTRDDLPSYALLNLSVIGKEFFKTMEIQGTVFNLLDKDYSDPGPTSISEDLPRPGRTFWVGLSYQF